MTLAQIAKLVLVIVMLSAGQVLFKMAAMSLRAGTLRETLISMMLSPQMIVALAIYGVATLLWVLLLRDIPLSRAYPVTALATFIVPAIGLVFFKEPFSWSLVVGGILMVAGIYIIASR